MKEFFTHATPEETGVSSIDILNFIKNLERFGENIHSFALIKGNSIIAEGYKKPFNKNDLHRMYSISKSFASMALGLLVGENKVSLDDYVLKYFPEYEETTKDPFIRNMKIREILKMSSCYKYWDTYSVKGCPAENPDWVGSFFNVPSTHPSGTLFRYDSSASYIIDVIVEKVTGMPFLEYLKEKALLQTGFSKNSRCVKSPDGYSWGASGVLCTTLDLARLARLVMSDGKWDGKQLLPEDYVKAAKSIQIDNALTGFKTTHSGHGYGYQIWCTLDNTFSFIGMGQQLAVCMPDEDLIFVCNSDVQGLEGAYEIAYVNLWNFIKDRFSQTPLSPNPDGVARLKEFVDNWEYPVVQGDKTNTVAEKINGKTFVLNDNPMGIKEITFNFGKDGNATMDYINNNGKKSLKFGVGKAMIDEFPEDGYSAEQIGKDGGRRYRCISSGAFTNSYQLHIKCDIIDDYFGNLSIIAGFKDSGEIGIYMQKHAEWFLDNYNGFAGGKIK